MEAIFNFRIKPFIRMFLGNLLFNLDQRNVDKTFSMPYDTPEDVVRCRMYRTRRLELDTFDKMYNDAMAYGEQGIEMYNNKDLFKWHVHTFLFTKIIEMRIYRAICALLNLEY